MFLLPYHPLKVEILTPPSPSRAHVWVEFQFLVRGRLTKENWTPVALEREGTSFQTPEKNDAADVTRTWQTRHGMQPGCSSSPYS